MQRAEWSWHEVGSCAPTGQQWASGIEAVCSSKPHRGGQTFHEPAFLCYEREGRKKCVLLGT
jgi:hypothetical protein